MSSCRRSSPPRETPGNEGRGLYPISYGLPEGSPVVAFSVGQVGSLEVVDHLRRLPVNLTWTQSDLLPGIAHALLPDSDPR